MGGIMTMEKLWRKVEPVLFYFATLYMWLLVYFVIVYHPKIDEGSFWGRMFVVFVVSAWWKGFKNRLAKFIRESLRGMIVEELAESRIAFVTWLREDSPWRVDVAEESEDVSGAL